jgi:hypothetical protein
MADMICHKVYELLMSILILLILVFNTLIRGIPITSNIHSFNSNLKKYLLSL